MADKDSKPEQLYPYERVAYRIYNGDTHELVDGIKALELIIECERSNAAHRIGSLLSARLKKEGYIVVTDIDETLAQFHLEEFSTDPKAA